MTKRTEAIKHNSMKCVCLLLLVNLMDVKCALYKVMVI